MFKENKRKIIVTSFLTLLPMYVGCILWNRLPDEIATHFSADNIANGWSSKPFTVFAIPIFLLIAHFLGLMATAADPKQKNIGPKPLQFVFWIVPAISFIMTVSIYANALGYAVDIGFSCSLLLGLILIILGNTLPKAKQNYTFGFKLPWTLHDPENWNRTNRLAGWCMVAAGIVILATSYWHNSWIIFAALLTILLLPTVYSYIYYIRHTRQQ